MEAKEFRIGNAVFSKYGEIAIIDTIGFNSIRLSTNTYKAESQCYDDIKPVEITEVKLLKIGFVKCEGRHGIYYKHNENFLFRIWESFPSKFWGAGRKDPDCIGREYNTYWITLNLEFLHQLQNLYFDLTGEDIDVSKLFEQ